MLKLKLNISPKIKHINWKKKTHDYKNSLKNTRININWFKKEQKIMKKTI
jgi:hypothetical protein